MLAPGVRGGVRVDGDHQIDPRRLARALVAACEHAGVVFHRTWAERFPTLHRVLANKYYVDEIYDALIVKPLAGLSRFFWKVVDTYVIDGTINAGAYLTELTGDVGRFSTTGNVRSYALYFFVGVILLGCWLAFG